MDNNLSPRQISPKSINVFLEITYGLFSTQDPVIMNGGTVNAGWSITTQNGKYILKVFSTPLDDGRSIEEELDLYRHLEKNMVNVPKVLSTKGNQAVGNINVQNQSFPTILMKLEQLRRASPVDISNKEIVVMAKAVANMHSAFQSYDKQLSVKKIALPKGVRTNGNALTDLESPNGANLSKNEKINIMNLEMKMVEYTRLNPLPLNSKAGLLHGDLSLGHVQFLADGSVYIYDFSDYTFGPLVWELATFFVYFFKEGGITFLRWKKICSQFLKEYSKNIRIPSKDITCLKMMIIDRLLFEIRTLNRLSRVEGRVVDYDGNINRYKLAKKLLEEDFLLQ